MSDPDRMPHPGRTSAERRALDRIGCGEPPSCSQKTLRNMLDAGLIMDVGTETCATPSDPTGCRPTPCRS